MLNIYQDRKVIKLPYPIDYHDIKKISKELDLSDFGNTIELPMNTEWYRLMENDMAYNICRNSEYHNKRIIIFYMTGFNEKITTFSTDYSVHSESVLTHSDVQNIIDAVSKIHHAKKIDHAKKISHAKEYNEKINDILLDPVTLDILRDPFIASDGITYSRATLERLFDNPNPISPMTREPLILINGAYGLRNTKLQEMIAYFEL